MKNSEHENCVEHGDELTPPRNFETIDLAHEFDKFDQNKFKGNTKLTFKSSTKFQIGGGNGFAPSRYIFFHVEVISNRRTVM
jgi:hypothetical protein